MTSLFRLGLFTLLAVVALLTAGSPALWGQTIESTVLVVGNANEPQSVAVVDYYMSKRNIPAANKLLLNWIPNSTDTSDDWCNSTQY